MKFLKKEKYFKEVSNEWLLLKKLSIKYSTYTKYENIINTHLNISFDNLLMSEIHEDFVMTYFHELIEKNIYSISTLKSIRYVLKSILEYSQMKYHTMNINFNFIKLGKSNNGYKPLTIEQKVSLESHCFQRYEGISLVVLLSLYGGFRLGEVAGLKWEDIDFHTGSISVNRTIERLKVTQESETKTQLMILEPKTITSKRIVPIPKFILDYIRKYYELFDVKDITHYIYTNSHKISDPRNIQYHFQKICQLYGFQINFHTLRHTYATNCIMNDIDVKSLSEMLGHSSVSITLELYVHSTLEFKINQVNKLQKPSFITEL